MNKQDILKKAVDNDERLLFSHMCDLYYRADKTNQLSFSDFLTPGECNRIRECFMAGEDLHFYGGYDSAERCIAIFGSDYSEYVSCPVVKLKVKSKSGISLTHRDYLGSVLALGIKRSNIGDILIFDEYAIIFCMEDMADYLVYNLTKVANTGVVVEVTDEDVVVDDDKRFKESDATVASMRLDCIVSAFTKKSRTTASELIKDKKVFLNYTEMNSSSVNVSDGDVISVRGFGKARICTDNHLTKKGRIHIRIKYYI